MKWKRIPFNVDTLARLIELAANHEVVFEFKTDLPRAALLAGWHFDRDTGFLWLRFTHVSFEDLPLDGPLPNLAEVKLNAVEKASYAQVLADNATLKAELTRLRSELEAAHKGVEHFREVLEKAEARDPQDHGEGG